MRRFITALALGAGLFIVAAGPAWADGIVPWEGNGSENLPCADGGHWVLAPSFGVESATLVVDGQSYTMHQSGQGSWSADSVGEIAAGVDAYVEFTGEGDAKNHLQLSHCNDTSPSPSPSPSESPSPSPSESPSPSPSPSESPSPSPSESPSPSPSESPSPSPSESPSPSPSVQPSESPSPPARTTTPPPTVAFTGPPDWLIPALFGVSVLALAGIAMYLRGRHLRNTDKLG